MPLYLSLFVLLWFMPGASQADEGQIEWDRLNEEVMQLFQAGQYEAALVPAKKALQLARTTYGPGHQNVALALNNLAALSNNLGDYAKAEAHYRQALAIKQKLLGDNDPDIALSLNNLAALYKTQARYSEAEPLYQRALAIWEQALGPKTLEVATALNNLAILHDTQGEAAKAEPLYRRSLAIREELLGPWHPAVALVLNNLAALLYNQGESPKAEPLYQRALAIREKALGPEHPDVALSLNNLAVLYKAQGDFARAEPLYQRALAIDERLYGPNHPELATDLNNLAALYDSLGNAARAEPLYKRSLGILEQALGSEHPRIAEGLNNLALLYKTQGDYAKAQPLYERALGILEQAHGPDHPLVASALNNLAVLYDSQGQHAKARPLFERVLAIRRQRFGPEHLLLAISLNNLAELYRQEGELSNGHDKVAIPDDEKPCPFPSPQPSPRGRGSERALHDFHTKALSLYTEAYWIGKKVKNPQFLADVLDNLSRFLAVQGQQEAAIFFGKEAVNSLQGLRGNISALDKETRKGFDETIEDVYRHLARLLVAADRLPEAELTLELFKEQELFRFLRQDAAAGLLQGRMPLTAMESSQDEGLKADDSYMAFEQAFAHILSAFKQAQTKPKQQLPKADQDIQADLGKLRQASGEVAAVLYTIADELEYGLILVTADERSAYQVALKPLELHRRIGRFRALIQARAADIQTEARELLDIILPPEARARLERLGVQSLIWHLDGPLRLLPLAALHDGSGYLIERYRLASFMATDVGQLLKSGRPQWRGLGFGVSEEREVNGRFFGALPAVPDELRTVIQSSGDPGQRAGVIPGNSYLDQAFDWPEFQRLLSGHEHSLLHIASHFQLEPGNDTQSFLLTGAGAPISLALLNSQQQLFAGLELVTLSACNTAVAVDRGLQGREVDGLAFIAQRQGASAVLASLWPVADEATAQLMAKLYRLLEEQKLGKAEALRQAQLALLGAGGSADADAQQHPYAHPFFWAPFVLMGNWQ